MTIDIPMVLRSWRIKAVVISALVLAVTVGCEPNVDQGDVEFSFGATTIAIDQAYVTRVIESRSKTENTVDIRVLYPGMEPVPESMSFSDMQDRSVRLILSNLRPEFDRRVSVDIRSDKDAVELEAGLFFVDRQTNTPSTEVYAIYSEDGEILAVARCGVKKCKNNCFCSSFIRVEGVPSAEIFFKSHHMQNFKNLVEKFQNFVVTKTAN